MSPAQQISASVEVDDVLETDPAILKQWREEYEAAARRPLAQRMHYGFVKSYKPVMDDEGCRTFETMEDYRRWCEEYLPRWLGYHRV